MRRIEATSSAVSAASRAGESVIVETRALIDDPRIAHGSGREHVRRAPVAKVLRERTRALLQLIDGARRNDLGDDPAVTDDVDPPMLGRELEQVSAVVLGVGRRDADGLIGQIS